MRVKYNNFKNISLRFKSLCFTSFRNKTKILCHEIFKVSLAVKKFMTRDRIFEKSYFLKTLNKSCKEYKESRDSKLKNKFRTYVGTQIIYCQKR